MYTKEQLLELVQEASIDSGLKMAVKHLLKSGESGSINITATLDFPETFSSSCPSLTVEVNGAELGDFVIVSGPVLIPGAFYTSFVSNKDEVTVRLHNTISGPINLPSSQFKIKVIK